MRFLQIASKMGAVLGIALCAFQPAQADEVDEAFYMYCNKITYCAYEMNGGRDFVTPEMQRKTDRMAAKSCAAVEAVYRHLVETTDATGEDVHACFSAVSELECEAMDQDNYMAQVPECGWTR